MISYIFEESDWNKGIEASSLEQLKSFVESCLPFVKDAHKACKQMKEADFHEFKNGLGKERKGVFAGEEWAKKFGAILLPENLLNCSMMANQFKVPLGVALLRARDEGLLK